MVDQKVLIIICVEKGYLENMAKLLIRSLRQNGGQYNKVKIVAYQPRVDHQVSQETLDFYTDHDVECIKDNLNTDFVRYPIANKILACHHAEINFPEYNLLFLDTDIFFMSEPTLFGSCQENQIFVRPVDIKNVGSNYQNDSNTDYWKNLYSIFNINKEEYVLTSVTQEKILQYFNAGHIMSQAQNGFFGQWKDNFLKLVQLRLFPKQGIFFIDQISLALTISKMDMELNILPNEYNYPIHRRNQMIRELRIDDMDLIVNAHYHKMFTFGNNPIYNDLNRCENGRVINELIAEYQIVTRNKNME